MSCNTNCCNTSCTTNTSSCVRGPCGPCGPAGPVGPAGPAGPAGPSATPNLKYITSDAAFDYSAETTSFNIVLDSSTAIGTGATRNIKLPQPTATNAGMVVKILVSTSPDSTNGVRIGFSNAGSAVMKGGVTHIQHTTDTENSVHVNTTNAKAVFLRSGTADHGGEAGTAITITYCGLNVANVSGIATSGTASTAVATVGTNMLSTTGWA